MSELKLRESQSRILNYERGMMGILDVPGSGKTWTLSRLAAKLILESELQPDQEILVVTFSKSAEENFSSRISDFLRQSGFLAGIGYQVRTLHGLANDIIHERPELAGLPNGFRIIDEAESDEILKNLVTIWMEKNPEFLSDLLVNNLPAKKVEDLRRKELPTLVKNITKGFIKKSKDLLITSDEMSRYVKDYEKDNRLLLLGESLYSQYQNAVSYREAVDFDDLIRYAYQCLISDDQLVSQLRYRWPFILEDEAQDSSQLQEKILRLLVGQTGNWVRVGDVNQAIYESFTTANPNLLVNFLTEPNVRSENLPESGRSSPSLINLANCMIDWVRLEHPNESVRDALTLPKIEPTLADDPQPNPVDREDAVEFHEKSLTSEQELNFVVKEVKDWLEKEPGSTVAVLSFINDRVALIAEKLRLNGIKVVDSLMNLPEITRLSAGAIANILMCVTNPTNKDYLSRAFQVWKRNDREDQSRWNHVKICSALLNKCENTEDFLYPQIGKDWLSDQSESGISENIIKDLICFREIIRKWHLSALLSLDQLIVSISYDLILDPVELATIHKLSVLVKELEANHAEWSMHDLIDEVIKIANNKRRFFNFCENEKGFDPDQYKGMVVVATMHKCKGLEWDKVFITSANNYDFPSGAINDEFMGEKYYLRDRLNLEAQLMFSLDELFLRSEFEMSIKTDPGLIARQNVIRERLRLLYVGMTRARKSLTISWNTGKRKNCTSALAVTETIKPHRGES